MLKNEETVGNRNNRWSFIVFGLAVVLVLAQISKRGQETSGERSDTSEDATTPEQKTTVNVLNYKNEKMSYFYGGATYFQYRYLFSEEGIKLKTFRFYIQDIRFTQERISLSYLDYNDSVFLGGRLNVVNFGYKTFYGEDKVELSMSSRIQNNISDLLTYIFDLSTKSIVENSLSGREQVQYSNNNHLPEPQLKNYDLVGTEYKQVSIFKWTSDINWYQREKCETQYKVKGEEQEFYFMNDVNNICDEEQCPRMVLNSGKYQQSKNTQNIIKYSSNNFNFSSPTSIYYTQNSVKYQLVANYVQHEQKIKFTKYECETEGLCNKQGILIKKSLIQQNITFMKLFMKNNNEIYIGVKETSYNYGDASYLVIYDLKILTETAVVEIARIVITNDMLLCNIGQVDIKHITSDYFVVAYPILNVSSFQGSIKITYNWNLLLFKHVINEPQITIQYTKILDQDVVHISSNFLVLLYNKNCLFTEEYIVLNRYQLLVYPLLKRESTFTSETLATSTDPLKEIFYFLVSQKISYNSAKIVNVFMVTYLESDLSFKEFPDTDFTFYQSNTIGSFSQVKYYHSIVFQSYIHTTNQARLVHLDNDFFLISSITDSWKDIFTNFVVNIVNPKVSNFVYTVSGTQKERSVDSMNFVIQFYNEGFFYNFVTKSFCGEMEFISNIVYEKFEYDNNQVLQVVCGFGLRALEPKLVSHPLLKMNYSVGANSPILYLYVKRFPLKLSFAYTQASSILETKLYFSSKIPFTAQNDLLFLVNNFVPLPGYNFSDKKTKFQSYTYFLSYAADFFEVIKSSNDSHVPNFSPSKYFCGSSIKITGYKQTSSGSLRSIEKAYMITISFDEPTLSILPTVTTSLRKTPAIKQFKLMLRDYFTLPLPTFADSYQLKIYDQNSLFVSSFDKTFRKNIAVTYNNSEKSIKLKFHNNFSISENTTWRLFFGYKTKKCGYEEYVPINLILETNIMVYMVNSAASTL